MGIPGFATWLRQRYPEAFGGLQGRDGFDNVYVDLQSTLHVVTRKAHNPHGFHLLLHRRLDELLAKLAPRRRVILAMDGPAPLAKLLEQRRRRRREADRTELAELGGGGSSSSLAASSKSRKFRPISPLFLTTGTLFMLEVHNSLVYYICRTLSHGTKHRHVAFELSDSTVKGEGELKILSRLLHSTANTSSDASEEESHVIVGGDSDLLLMTMISGKRRVTLWDDAPERQRRSHLDQKAFSRDALEETWRKESLGKDATQADVTTMALDLTLLAIMCSGNDYLPACQGLQLQNKSRPGLWNLYLDMRRQPEWQGQSLITRSCPGCSGGSQATASCGPCPGGAIIHINNTMLSSLLQRYQEQRYCVSENGSNGDNGPSFDIMEGAWTFGGSHGASEQLNKPPLPPLEQPWRHPADPVAYFQGLEWVLTMYATGAITDYRFAYQGSSPTVCGLLEHMKSRIMEGSTALPQAVDHAGGVAKGEISNEGGEPAQTSRNSGSISNSRRPSEASKFPSRQPLMPAACALALLPARSRKQAATALRHLMDADSPVAEIYAVCKECQQLALRLRSVGAELDNVRRELTMLQSKLSAAALDSEGPHEVESDLSAAAARCEAAQDKLREVLGDLSRSQQEHLRAKHPYKPFPTAELEAAVNAVPAERYPPRERKLARFGREMAFRYDESAQSVEAAPKNNAEDGGADGITEEGSSPADSERLAFSTVMPGWLKDASRFATVFPRLGNQEVVMNASQSVVRELLPLYPYMRQYESGTGRRSRGSQGQQPPTALYMACQLRRYTTPIAPFGSASVIKRTPIQTALAACVRLFPRFRTSLKF